MSKELTLSKMKASLPAGQIELDYDPATGLAFVHFIGRGVFMCPAKMVGGEVVIEMERGLKMLKDHAPDVLEKMKSDLYGDRKADDDDVHKAKVQVLEVPQDIRRVVAKERD